MKYQADEIMDYDIIIIGGGIIGTATAYYLKKNQSNLKIGLVEQYEKIGSGNTSKSAALYRNLFGSEMSRILAESSYDFYQ